MKIKVSIVYLVLYVLGVIAAGVLTGIYGNDMSIWISYGFLAAYGIMILINATIIERVAKVKIETSEEPSDLTPEQIKSLPPTLGKGEEKKVGETTLETRDVPLPPIPTPPLPPSEIKEEQPQMSEEDKKTMQKILDYIETNLGKGHSLDKIKNGLVSVGYNSEAIDKIIKASVVFKEPELPDLGEPEEIVTPKTLDKEIKESKGNFKCDKCGKTFKAEGYLKNHMRLSKKCQSL